MMETRKQLFGIDIVVDVVGRWTSGAAFHVTRTSAAIANLIGASLGLNTAIAPINQREVPLSRTTIRQGIYKDLKMNGRIARVHSFDSPYSDARNWLP